MMRTPVLYSASQGGFTLFGAKPEMARSNLIRRCGATFP